MTTGACNSIMQLAPWLVRVFGLPRPGIRSDACWRQTHRCGGQTFVHAGIHLYTSHHVVGLVGPTHTAQFITDSHCGVEFGA